VLDRASSDDRWCCRAGCRDLGVRSPAGRGRQRRRRRLNLRPAAVRARRAAGPARTPAPPRRSPPTRCSSWATSRSSTRAPDHPNRDQPALLVADSPPPPAPRSPATRPVAPRSGAAHGGGLSGRPRSGAAPARPRARLRRDPLRPAAVPLQLAALRCGPRRSWYHRPAEVREIPRLERRGAHPQPDSTPAASTFF
jgi:hypothetical protein